MVKTIKPVDYADPIADLLDIITVDSAILRERYRSIPKENIRLLSHTQVDSYISGSPDLTEARYDVWVLEFEDSNSHLVTNTKLSFGYTVMQINHSYNGLGTDPNFVEHYVLVGPLKESDKIHMMITAFINELIPDLMQEGDAG